MPSKGLSEKYIGELREIVCDILFNSNGIDSNNAVLR